MLMQGQGDVFFMAATLRPETMYGQTNCWVLPDGEYGAYRGPCDDVYVMATRSARNLLWQVCFSTAALDCQRASDSTVVPALLAVQDDGRAFSSAGQQTRRVCQHIP